MSRAASWRWLTPGLVVAAAGLVLVACGSRAVGGPEDLEAAAASARSALDATIAHVGIVGETRVVVDVCQPSEREHVIAVFHGDVDDPVEGVAMFNEVRSLWAGLPEARERFFRPAEDGQASYTMSWSVLGGPDRAGGYELFAGLDPEVAPAALTLEAITGCYSTG